MTSSEKYMMMINALQNFLCSAGKLVSELEHAEEIMRAGLHSDDKSKQLESRTETMLNSVAEIKKKGDGLIDSLQATYIKLKEYEEE